MPPPSPRNPSRPVVVAVLGDEGVGKTALISTLISGVFPGEFLPRRLEPIVLPADASYDERGLMIVDTDNANEDTMRAQVKGADVVMLVYASDSPDSFNRVANHWLRRDFLDKTHFDKPIIVVGNKQDLLDDADPIFTGGGSEDSSPSPRRATKHSKQPPPEVVITMEGENSDVNSSSSNYAMAMRKRDAKGEDEDEEDEDELERESEEADYVRRAREEQERKLRVLLEVHPRVDACLEASAKMNLNVSDAFYFAQHAHLFPVFPLLDMTTTELRPRCRLAFTRVFRMFDEDRDGLLSDVEFNNFQEECFAARLPMEDLTKFKLALSNEGLGFVVPLPSSSPSHPSEAGPAVSPTSASTAATRPTGVTLSGFFHLQRLYVLRNRPENCWRVLRKFGYDEELNLNCARDVVMCTPLMKFARNQTLELTRRGHAFLAGIFHQFDADLDGALSPAELKEMFSCTPSEGADPFTLATGGDTAEWEQFDVVSFDRTMPAMGDFPRGILTNAAGNVTLSGWLAHWSMALVLRPRFTLLWLRYLGFAGDLATAVSATSPKSGEDGKLTRSVVRAFVFGAKGVGKSSLLDALVKKSSSSTTTTTTSSPRNAAAAVKPVGDRDRERNTCLVLTEVPSGGGGGGGNVDFSDCDLAVMVFACDDVASVEELARIQASLPPHVPCVYFANKAEKSVAQVRTAGEALTKRYSLVAPEPVSLVPAGLTSGSSAAQQSRAMERTFEVLLTTALLPAAARPMTEERRAEEKRRRAVRAALRISAVVMGVGVTFFAARYLLSSSSTSTKRGDEKDDASR